jgi:branched-chain amino acid transport system permease protein
MEVFLRPLINALLISGVYTMVAVGLSLIFGVLKIINFAHGAFLMLSMYMGYWFWKITGLNNYLAILVVIPLMLAFGYLAEMILVEPLIKRERAEVVEPLSVLLVTTGLWLLLENAALVIFKADPRAIQIDYPTIQLYKIFISVDRLIVFLISIMIVIALYVFLTNSTMGKKIRATTQDRDAAALQGIDIYRIYRITFGLGTAIVGLCGVLILPAYYTSPSVGSSFIINAFVVIVLGGIGSIPGVLVASIIVALVESFGTAAISTSMGEMLVFIVFILFLLFRPQGLFRGEG